MHLSSPSIHPTWWAPPTRVFAPDMFASVCFKCFRCSRGMLQLFHMNVANIHRDVAFVAKCSRGMLQVFQRHVATVCSKCFICFRRTLQVFFMWMLHMFHTYVLRVCLKCFHVASCKCFIWILHMFRTRVASVCSKCFICFKRMLYLSVSCVQVFRVSEVCSESHWGMAQGPCEGVQRAQTGGWGVWHAWGPTDGTCSSSSWLPCLARTAREERRGSGERSDGHGAGETDGGGVRVCVRGETRQTGKD
jgi:hypothetical protein